MEPAAHARPALVDRAKEGHGVQGDACAVAVLVHEQRALMLDRELPRDIVDAGRDFHRKVTTAAASETCGKSIEGVWHHGSVDNAQNGSGGDARCSRWGSAPVATPRLFHNTHIDQ